MIKYDASPITEQRTVCCMVSSGLSRSFLKHVHRLRHYNSKVNKKSNSIQEETSKTQISYSMINYKVKQDQFGILKLI